MTEIECLVAEPSKGISGRKVQSEISECRAGRHSEQKVKLNEISNTFRKNLEENRDEYQANFRE